MRKVRSIFLGLSALVLMGSASANAGVVGTDVTINYLSPTVTSVLASSVLPITTNPTTLDCPAFGSGVCAAFVENAAITIGADSFTVVENSGSFYATEPFNGIEYELSSSHSFDRVYSIDQSVGAHSCRRQLYQPFDRFQR